MRRQPALLAATLVGALVLSGCVKIRIPVSAPSASAASARPQSTSKLPSAELDRLSRGRLRATGVLRRRFGKYSIQQTDGASLAVVVPANATISHRLEEYEDAYVRAEGPKVEADGYPLPVLKATSIERLESAPESTKKAGPHS